MKKLILILIALLLQAASVFSQELPPLKVSIQKIRAHSYPFEDLYLPHFRDIRYAFRIKQIYDIAITITNQADRDVYYCMMTCGKEFNLTIDNDLFFFAVSGCDSNYPFPYELHPGQSDTIVMSVARQTDPLYTYKYVMGIKSRTDLRIGLLLVNDLYNWKDIWEYDNRMKEISKWQRIFWSNYLVL